MNNNKYGNDRFYVDLENETVTWIYHEPDGPSGDRFVKNVFSIDLLEDIIYDDDYNGDACAAFDSIAQSCDQDVCRRGSDGYGEIKELYESRPDVYGLSDGTLNEISYYFLAKEYIDEYCMKEYRYHPDFSDKSRIGLGYTTTLDGRHELQMYANFTEHRNEIYADGKKIAEWESKDFMNYVIEQLDDLSYDDLSWLAVSLSDDVDQRIPRLVDLEVRGTHYELCIEASRYTREGKLQLFICRKCGEMITPFLSMSVFAPGYEAPSGCALVDTNVSDIPEKLIRKYRLGSPTGRSFTMDGITYPEYRFDERRLERFCTVPKDAMQSIEERIALDEQRGEPGFRGHPVLDDDLEEDEFDECLVISGEASVLPPPYRSCVGDER